MINSVNSSQNVERYAGGKDPQTSNPAGQVNFMRGNKYERTVDSDSFVSENKKPKRRGAKIIGTLVAATAVVGGICLRKGGKVLEGQEATIKEKLSAGWKELTGKGKKVAEDAAKKVEEDAAKKAEEKAAKGAAEKAEEKAAKEAAEKVEEKAAKEAEAKAAEKAQEAEKFKSDIDAREQRAAEWREKSQSIVDEFERKLNGSVSVEVNPVTQAEREQMLKDAKASADKLSNHARKGARDAYRKDIDSILNRNEIKDLETLYAFQDEVMKNGTKTQKELFTKIEAELKAAAEKQKNDAVKEAQAQAQAAEWKAKTDGIVSEFEKKLDGSGYMETTKVPKKRTNFEHKRLQNVYDKELSAELNAREWKAETDGVVGGFEKKLDGKINADTIDAAYRKPTHAEHKAKQAYYDSLSDEIAAHNERVRTMELEKENKTLREQLKKFQ